MENGIEREKALHCLIGLDAPLKVDVVTFKRGAEVLIGLESLLKVDHGLS